ncbi:ArsC family reductase [Utexia brackfieldae]|uniref:ArsC family reductase n=1 Tax=Utexia brackfieldae TaxID=3074108 RepID=UPI00370D8A87
MYQIYGIKNCDTMKKAFTWLDEHHVQYQFHNYKTEGLSEALLNDLCNLVDWQLLLNTRGTTWRKLDEAVREKVNNVIEAKKIMLSYPSIIKRPVLVMGQRAQVGFSAESYQQFIEETHHD